MLENGAARNSSSYWGLGVAGGGGGLRTGGSGVRRVRQERGKPQVDDGPELAGAL